MPIPLYSPVILISLNTYLEQSATQSNLGFSWQLAILVGLAAFAIFTLQKGTSPQKVKYS